MNERALIATTLTDPVILATDGACVAWDIGENGINTRDLGMVKKGDCKEPGLYLWEGKMEKRYYAPEDCEDFSYVGTIRPVKSEEVAELFAMKPPPDPMDDDRDQPIVWNGMTVGP